MGLLHGTSTYLIGSVENHEDPRAWRRDIANNLLTPMGVKVYDPLVKPDWFNEDFPANCDPEKDFLRFKEILERRHQNKAVQDRMWAVRDLCLRMVHDANFIIASIPKKFTVGTFEELQAAAQAKKPILLYLPEGSATSTWLPAQIDRDTHESSGLESFYDRVFTSMDDLYQRIRDIDAGEAYVNNLEWIFLSYFNDKAVINEFSNHQQT